MDYLTVAQVARRLRRHPKLVYRWIAEGRLRAERAGSVWLVHKETLARFAPPARKWSTKSTGRKRRRNE